MDKTVHISASDYVKGNFDCVVKKSAQRCGKYNAKKTWIDGICFDSNKEADYYVELKILQKNGAIKGFCRQPRFLLEAGTGKDDRATEYVSDFIIFNNDGSTEIVDVKGMKTEVFKDKMKRFKHRFPGLEVETV